MSTPISHLRGAVRVCRIVTAGVIAFLCVACGDGGGPGPSPQPTGLRFPNASEVLLIGAPQRFAPVLVFQDGSTQPAPVSTTWTSADSAIATVDPTGLATGLANGTTSLVATSSSFTATLTLRVAPNYGGAWGGRFVVTTCGRVAAFPLSNFCSAIAGPQDLQLSITQTGLAAAGTLGVFGAQGPIAATVDGDGALLVTGTVTIPSGNSSFLASLTTWRTTLLENAMSGSFAMRWTVAGSPDVTAEFAADVSSLTRSAPPLLTAGRPH